MNLIFKKCLTRLKIDFNKVHTLRSMFLVNFSNSFENKTLSLMNEQLQVQLKLIIHGI